MAKKVCLYVSIFVEAGHMEAVEAVGGCQAGDERVKDVLENRKLNFTSMTKASSGCQALASPPSFFLYLWSTAQWSSSLGRGWHNCSKMFRRLFNGYVPTHGKRIKGHVCLHVYEYFSLFGQETHFLTKFPYFWGFFWLLKLIWGDYSCFRNV